MLLVAFGGGGVMKRSATPGPGTAVAVKVTGLPLSGFNGVAESDLTPAVNPSDQRVSCAMPEALVWTATADPVVKPLEIRPPESAVVKVKETMVPARGAPLRFAISIAGVTRKGLQALTAWLFPPLSPLVLLSTSIRRTPDGWG